MPIKIQYGGLLWGFIGKFPFVPFFLLRGNRRLIAPYILLFNLLLIVSYLGGLVIRGVSAFTTADHLNRFSNSSSSLIRVARDWHVFWPDLDLALASLYPDSARDPAGDLWRYLVTGTSNPLENQAHNFFMRSYLLKLFNSCHGAISEGRQVRALNLLLTRCDYKNARWGGKEKK